MKRVVFAGLCLLLCLGACTRSGSGVGSGADSVAAVGAAAGKYSSADIGKNAVAYTGNSAGAGCISPDGFRDPSLRYAPLTRWWWPGNDVEPAELERELQLLASHHFGGVEIQSFALVVPPPMDRIGRIMGFDTDEYYANLRIVMEEAARLGMTVDLTHGSGWPASSPVITEAEENHSLQYGMAEVPDAGGVVPLPRSLRQDSEAATLAGLLLAEVREAGDGPGDGQEAGAANAAAAGAGNTSLEIRNVQVIPLAKEMDGGISCPSGKAPEGWRRQLIALWSVPSQEINMLVARPDAGKVLDHFDTRVLRKSYDHYFGQRTGLEPYYGHPLRSIFNDSYEFKVDRHFTEDFVETFRSRRGYDPVPWLPANIWYGYNNMYDSGKPAPEFTFGEEDWRLRYDYDLTVSDLIRRHLLRGSSLWARERGLLHKTQAYGLPMDYMGAAGDADIPETETMVFGGGSEGGLKMITSGAMLYDRGLVTAESGVHIDRALMVTPQKLRLTVDKLLSSGVNQIIWHGTPYRYAFGDGFWQPFYNPMLGINFSSDLCEANVFWDEIGQVNAYAQRAQYLMQQGRAAADILVYYPFLEYGDVPNPEEILHYGFLPDTEPSLPAPAVSFSESGRWLQAIWPVLNDLESRGFTWAWVNDESLQEMEADKAGKLHIRGNVYGGLLLFDLPYIQKETARNLRRQRSANMLILGDLPVRQPSFRDYARSDRETASLMGKVAAGKRVCRDAALWRTDMPVTLLSGGERVRQCRRILADGSLIQMFWNVNECDREIILAAAAPYAYWLDAETGGIAAAPRDDEGRLHWVLPSRSARFLVLSDRPMEEGLTEVPATLSDSDGSAAPAVSAALSCGACYRKIMMLDSWNRKPGATALDSSYTTVFEMPAVTADHPAGNDSRMSAVSERPDGEAYARCVLDLGRVCYTAEVFVNGRRVGKRIWEPFRFDITQFLRPGRNTLEVRVKISDYNLRVPQDRNGRMANGLLGPVRLCWLQDGK